MENNEPEESPQEEQSIDDSDARSALVRKAKRYLVFSIVAFCIAAFQLIELLTSIETKTLMSVFDSSIALVGVAAAGFTYRRLSKKFELRATQEGPLEKEPVLTFRLNRAAAAAGLGLVVFAALKSPQPFNLPVLVSTLLVNVVVLTLFFIENISVSTLRGAIILGGIACALIFWNAGQTSYILFQIIIGAYLFVLISGEPTRKRWKIATFIAMPLCGLIVFSANMSRLKKNDFNAKLEDYNSQLVHVEQAIDWNDPKSVGKGLYSMQNVADARAPYLDSFIYRMNESLALLRPSDTVRTIDTLNFIAWHRVFLQNLMWEKDQRGILDSLCTLITLQQMTTDSSAREANRVQIDRWSNELFQNDSAIQATHVVEVQYRKQIGKMEMPY